MERRSGMHLHFIQAIRSGKVEKVVNVDFGGRPGLVFKALKDIYDTEDVKRCPNLSTHPLENNKVMDSYSVKLRPLHVRKTKRRYIDSEDLDQKFKIDPEESDLDGKITLKQLKKGNREKKRKTSHFNSATVKQEYTDGQPEEDETDLRETISSWKAKVLKQSKGKKKSPEKCAPAQCQVKSEPISVGECSEPLQMVSEVCDPNLICGGDLLVETFDSVENELQSCNYSSLLVENEICPLNEVCYDHWENIEDDVFVKYPEIPFPQSENAPYPEDEEISIMSLIPGEVLAETALGSDLLTNDSMLEISMQGNKMSGDEVPLMTSIGCTASDLCEFNNYNRQKMPLYLNYVSSSPPLNIFSLGNCSNHEIVLACEEDNLISSQRTPVSSVSADFETQYIHNSPVFLLEASATIERELCRISPLDHEKRDSPDSNNQHFDSVSVNSVPETGNHSLITGPCHPPERLLSTRKAISPTSQERLCQAMKGVDLIEDADLYKCSGKLNMEDATESKPFITQQGAENNKVETHLHTKGEHDRKVTMRPKRTAIKRNSPPKGNQKSPDFSRSLPNFSTGTKSLQKISESAIAFSQRQMNDFECLATKLMLQMNSMKDIVEGKLQCQTSSADILKNDVDEVTSVIRSARKTEETTRKWLAMMTKDCNRFCTIMKFFENGEPVSPNKTFKERRKITFADEVGGVLCHVKVFNDGRTFVDSQG